MFRISLHDKVTGLYHDDLVLTKEGCKEVVARLIPEVPEWTFDEHGCARFEFTRGEDPRVSFILTIQPADPQAPLVSSVVAALERHRDHCLKEAAARCPEVRRPNASRRVLGEVARF